MNLISTENGILVLLLISCSIWDFAKQRIPNLITLPAVLFGLTYHSILNGFSGLAFSFLGLSVGIGLLLLPYLMGGMGAGDVKLMGAVGSFLGAKATFEASLLIALFGGIYSLAIILIRRDVFKGFFSEKIIFLSSMVTLKQYIPLQTETSGQKPRLKYGVAIAFGTITYLVLKSIGIKFLI